MTHKLHSFALLVVFALLIVAFPADVRSAPWETAPRPDSTTRPAGYSPRSSQQPSIRLAESADILLIQTSLPWDSTANTTVLDSLGYSYDIVDISNLGSVSLFSYPVILIVNDQAQSFYDAYAADVDTFESYVRGGGVLLFFAASDGWANGTLRADLPGSVEVITPHYETNNYIEDSSHPIVTAALSDNVPLTEAELWGNYCSHGYFQSLVPNTRIIFSESNGYPTMIDYPLGTGRVIASTNTWEFHYIYEYGDFAHSTLDDVFLYAFSGGGSIVTDLRVDLRVEDAPSNVEVRKSPNSYVDVVARIQGNTEYEPSVQLEVPDNKLGSPILTFTRNLPDDNGYLGVGSGQYLVNTKLVQATLNNQSTFLKEVVWRFKVPDNAASEVLTLSVKATQPGLIITNNTATAKLRIAETGNAILVTHRQRLFSEYGANSRWNTVYSLLEETFRAAAQQSGEVFYLDRYSVAWNSTTDETAANVVVEEIDALIEEWYDELKGGFLGMTQEPDYLVVIGGDEVLPFYRADDDDYGSCDPNKADCEDDYWASGHSANGVLWNVYDDNYFLTDNIYADVGGNKRNWENGDLELALGRIVGRDAAAMQTLIRNGYATNEPIQSAGLSSIGGSDVDKMSDALEDRGVNRLGESNPDLTENDAWRADDFTEVWQKDWQFFYFGAHASPNSWATGHKTGFSQQSIPWSDLDNANIAQDNPLLLSGGCNFAVPLAGGLTHFMVNQGFSGIVGSTGLAGYEDKPWFTSEAEKLDNEFVDELMSEDEITAPFGEVLRDVKRDFNPHTDSSRKTVLEYVYYGLPWSYASIADADRSFSPAEPPNGYRLTVSAPSSSRSADYQVTLHVDVDDYALETVDAYDLLIIDGAEVLADAASPALPYLVKTLFLPPNSAVNGLTLAGEHGVALGSQNLPAMKSVNSYGSGSGLLPISGSGLYPATRWAYQVVEFPDFTAVEVLVYLATYNVDNGQLTLFDSTDLVVTYTSGAPAVISSFALAQPTFLAGEAITGAFEVQNVTSSNRSFTARLDFLDASGLIVAQHDVPAFSVAPGAYHSQPFSLPGLAAHGPFEAVLTVLESGNPVVGGEDSFMLLDGQVTAFDAPANARPGEYADITLSFANYGSANVMVVAEVPILDRGVEVGKLLQRTFSVPPGWNVVTTWAWDPSAFPAGNYTLSPLVTVGETAYFAPQRDIRVSYYAPDFDASPTRGIAPLTVAFTNNSLAGYTGVSWDFGDQTTSQTLNPSHQYRNPGLYSVTLTVEGANGVETTTKAGYVIVYAPVSANFTAAPRSGGVPLAVDFSNDSTGDYDVCTWEFGDGETAIGCNAQTHIYEQSGAYDVSLTVSGNGGYNTITRKAYIQVRGWLFMPVIVDR